MLIPLVLTITLLTAAPATGASTAAGAPLKMPIAADSGKTVRHVGLGFMAGFAKSGGREADYLGPGKIPALSVRGNPTFGFNIYKAGHENYLTYNRARKGPSPGLIQVVISDGWDSKAWPYADSAGTRIWESMIDIWIRESVDRYGIGNVQFDIFNEPEGRALKSPRQEELDVFLNTQAVEGMDYFRNWRRTVAFIRSMPGKYASVKIVGPSLTGYHPFLLRFLEAARLDSVLPDVISWHEIDSESKDNLDASVSAVRGFLRSRGIADREISINEYTAFREPYNPGVAVAYFSRLEKAGVASAMRACHTREDCFSGNYNGIYSPSAAGFIPRSVWWAYLWYSELKGAALQPPPLGPSEAFLGAWDDSLGRIQLLFANAAMPDGMDSGTIAKESLEIGPLPSGLRGKCRITLEVIRNSGTRAYAAPVILRKAALTVGSAAIRVEKSALKAGDVFRLTLQKR